MATRKYDFDSGIETASAPTSSDPVADSDFMTKGYADSHYENGLILGPFAVTDGQAATNLTGVTVDSASYTSVKFEYEIIRGTTVFSTGYFKMHYRNGTWYLVTGPDDRDDNSAAHGVTFTYSGTTVAQIKAALDSGAGNGTIKIIQKNEFTA